jgi:hypothetical protein
VWASAAGKIVDGVTFERINARTRVRLTKRWPSRHEDQARRHRAPHRADGRSA